ncbi:MAG: IS630 transposase-related protein [Chloroflexales bacterium]|nr:IS630 transposase-related protein [Chloroflexales bacterium]
MKPYSVDLRERVLAAIDRGMARSEVVSTFDVSLASLKRWLASRRDTSDGRPRPLLVVRKRPSRRPSTTSCAPR